MAIEIRAFPTSDDVLVVWRSPEPIKDCVGFQLNRKRPGHGVETVNNRVTFSAQGADPLKPALSSASPIRRYAWTDHEPNQGDEVAYQVIPVIQPDGKSAQPDANSASP